MPITSHFHTLKKRINCLAALGLGCCALAFCICGEHSHSVAVGPGLLSAVAFVEERALYVAGSVVVMHGFSCLMACELFTDQGSNPSPALAGGLLTTGSPGKSLPYFLVNLSTPPLLLAPSEPKDLSYHTCIITSMSF